MIDYVLQSMDIDIDPKRPVRRYFVLDDDKHVVATGHVEMYEPNMLWIGSLFVHPDYRNKGIGKYMLDCMEKYAQHTGRQYLSLCVAIQNVAAQRLYQRLGFVDFAESYENFRQYIKMLPDEPALRNPAPH